MYKLGNECTALQLWRVRLHLTFANGASKIRDVWRRCLHEPGPSLRLTWEQALGLAILSSQRKKIRSWGSPHARDTVGLRIRIRPTYFLGDYRSCPLSERVRGNSLQTRQLIALDHSSNAKITSVVLWASLNNSFKDYWHSLIKTKMY
jgi:hypothetical protein